MRRTLSRRVSVLLPLLFLSTSALAQVEDGPPAPPMSELPAMEEVPQAEGPAPAFPEWSGLVATAGATGLLNAASSGGNPRPVSLGVGYARWSEFAELLAQAQVAPSVAADGPDAAGAVLRSGGRLGVSVSGRLHRLHARRPLPLTVGGYLGAGASLDGASGATWTGLRAEGGLSLHWWPVASPTSLAYATFDIGPALRHRTGEGGGTWLGLSTGVSVTVRRVSAGLTLTHVPPTATLLPGLTGTRVSAGVSLQADLLPL